MRQSSIIGVTIIIMVFFSCNNQSNSQKQADQLDQSVNQTKNNMKNLVSIIEIPVEDFSRAVSFYNTILDINIEEVEMGEDRLGLFPNDEESGSVHLIHGSDYQPSSSGTIVYLNAGKNLQTVADKIKANGGEILVPKTEIGPEMGFFALFLDTEGNRLGLFSGN